MLFLELRHAPVDANALGAFDSFVETLPTEYRCVLRPSMRLQAEILGVEAWLAGESGGVPVSPYDSTRVLRAEIVTGGSGVFVIQVDRSDPMRAYFTVGGAARAKLAEESDSELMLRLRFLTGEPDMAPLERFEELVAAQFGASLTAVTYRSPRFQELMDEGRTPPAPSSEAEISGARVLAEKATRSLAVAIKSSGGLLLGDIHRQLRGATGSRAPEIRAALQAAGLVQGEIVVICRKTQAQVARAPSQEVLAETSARGMRCACGREMADERVEEALTITDLGRSLLDGSRWLTVLLCEELAGLRVTRDRVLLEQQAGGYEMDCIADVNGDLVFFELKDKEFNLGNAYSFGAKIGIVRPDLSIILTTEAVGNDAKDHFQRARIGGNRSQDPWDEEASSPRGVRYIEGIENLGSALGELVTEINSRDATRLLSGVSRYAAIPPEALVGSVQRAPVLAAKATLRPSAA